MKLKNTLVVFDLETTGTWVEKDKVVEIAMIKCNVEGNTETYSKRVNPGIPIPPSVVELIGITDDDVKGAPFLKDIAGEILDFFGKADIAGFSIERFDLPLLERERSEAGYEFDWQKLKIYDAQKVYHINERRDLTAAYEFYCNKKLNDAHSALADAKATLEVLSAQVKEYGGEDGGVEGLGQFDYKNNTDFYDEGRRFRWWNGKLYIMFGKYAKKYALQDIVRRDRKYLEWILSADFSQEVKVLIDNALNGYFPSKKQ